MLTIGGSLTAIIILSKLRIYPFLAELKIGMEGIKIDWELVKTVSIILFIASTFFVGLSLLNEVSELVFGVSLQQMAGL